MNYLSNNTEDKIKVVIESYLIESILKLDNNTIQRINQERYNEEVLNVKYQMDIINILYNLFINHDFANFSISNEYIDKSDIVEILRYCKIKYTTIERREWWYSQISEWWFEGLVCNNDVDDIPYIICWFVYSYTLDNKNYIIELINKLYNNRDGYAVLK